MHFIYFYLYIRNRNSIHTIFIICYVKISVGEPVPFFTRSTPAPFKKKAWLLEPFYKFILPALAP